MTVPYQGPLATRLVALSNIQNLDIGDKVRFLGCVARYHAASALLSLEHDYPRGSKCNVSVDVQLLLGTLKHTDTCVGEWVNVMGYVTSQGATAISKPRPASIQALVIWSAGSLKLDYYEKTLDRVTAMD